LKSGIFFFKGGDLLLVHVAGADGADQPAAVAITHSEYDEYAPAFRCLANRPEARFLTCICHILLHQKLACAEQRLDSLDCDTMFPALVAVTFVPIDAVNSTEYEMS
jgi:hypothetical protein